MSDPNDEDNHNDYSLKKTEKENRWERIRNKHVQSLHITSNVVNNFYDMDYINEQQMKHLQGDTSGETFLNPVLVMNMRHNMIRRNPNYNGQNSQAIRRTLQIESMREHNDTIESNLIDNELSKFKSQLSALKPKMKARNIEVHNFISHLPEMDDNIIFKSLDDFKAITSSFYDKINDIHNLNTEQQQGDRNASGDENGAEKMQENKIVRFGDTIKVITYPKQNVHNTNTMSFSSSVESDVLDVESLETDSNFDEIETNIIMFNRVNANMLNGNHLHTPISTEDCCEIEEIFDLDEAKNDNRAIRGSLEQVNKLEKERIPAEDEDNEKVNLSLDIVPYNPLHYRFDDNTGQNEYLKINRMNGGNSTNSNDSSIDSESLPIDKDTYEEYLRMNINRECSTTESSSVSPDYMLPNTIINSLSTMQDPVDLQLNTDDRDLMLIKRIDLEPKQGDDNNLNENQKKKMAIIKAEEVKRFDTLKTYFQKWFQFIVVGRIKKGCELKFTRHNNRFKRINDLINKSKIEKKVVAVDDADGKCKKQETTATKKNFEHKLKIQQDIIELQKMKLERQERMINELKLSKFTEASKIANAEVKNELQHVAKSGHPKLRARAKCIQITANIKPEHDEADEIRKLQAQGLLVPKFLSRMQERAEERAQKHMEARDRRIRLEQEKEHQKLAAEDEKRKQDEEAKLKRIEELKEKRRLEKMEKLMREQEKQRMIANNKKAKEFYLRKLVQNYGMKQFKLLLKRRRLNIKKSQNFRRIMCMRTSFRAWSSHTQFVWDRRKQKACNHYNTKIKRCAFLYWKEFYDLQQSKLMVAVDWFEVKVTERIFKLWLGRTIQLKFIELNKMKNAEAHYNWQLKFKVMDRWQRLPTILKIEKETEQRREKWRMKIWELLPDYKPLKDD